MSEENKSDFELKKLKGLLKAQEDFLSQLYNERDNLLNENRRLNNEISKLTRTVVISNNYINYLLNSFWWKSTAPFRSISRKIKRNRKLDYNFIENIKLSDNIKPIEEKVSIIIFTYNPGVELEIQLKNLTVQKYINDIEIILIDKGSKDNTEKIASKYNARFIKADGQLTDSELYDRCLPNINGKYVVIIEQNKVLDSKYWIYQSIRPIRDKKAISTIFFRNEEDFKLKEITYYAELKQRFEIISDNKVLFFPENRDIIQYLSTIILDKSSIIVKEKVSNMFLV